MVFFFVSRRIQHLQRRKHPVFRYDGVNDRTWFTPEPLTCAEIVRMCYNLLDNFDESLTLPALFWAGNPPENFWVSTQSSYSSTFLCILLVVFLMKPFLQKNYKTWYCMPPPPADAAQSDGDNGKKRKAAPGSQLQRKVYRLNSVE